MQAIRFPKATVEASSCGHCMNSLTGTHPIVGGESDESHDYNAMLGVHVVCIAATDRECCCDRPKPSCNERQRGLVYVINGQLSS